MSRTSVKAVLCWRAATVLKAELAFRHSLQHAARSALRSVFSCALKRARQPCTTSTARASREQSRDTPSHVLLHARQQALQSLARL